MNIISNKELIGLLIELPENNAATFSFWPPGKNSREPEQANPKPRKSRAKVSMACLGEPRASGKAQ